MTRRTLSVALIVLGAIAVLAAIASATIWRPTDTATLSLPARPDAPVVVSDPGVLDAVGPDVTIEATAGSDEPVLLAVGRTADVDAWVGTAAHTRITGLASWEQLEVTDAAGEATAEATADATAEATEEATAEPAALPDPAGSDLWVVEQTGTGSAQIEWEDRDGRWSLLAATDGTAAAPDVTLTWSVEVDTPWLVPGLILGGLLLIAGAALLVLDTLTAREMRRRPEPAPVGEQDTDPDRTDVLPATTGATAVLTRRELRERERAAARRRGRGRTGEIPVVTTTGEIPVAAAPTRELDAAGTARGAGIVPASARSAELRAHRAPAEEERPATEAADGAGSTTGTAAATGAEAGTGAEDVGEAAGVARGAAVVPASDGATDLRAQREQAEGPGREPGEGSAGVDDGAEVPPVAGADAAGWTEGEAGDEVTAVLPAAVPEEPTAEEPTAEEPTAEAPTAEGPSPEEPAPDEPTGPGATAEERRDDDRPAQGWRSMWGFRGRGRTDEGEEQR